MSGRSRHGFLRPFLALFLAGLVGVAALAPTLPPPLRALMSAPGAPPAPLPLEVLVALTLLQLAALTALFTALGVGLAHRLGLRSHIAERASGGVPLGPALRRELPLAALLGAAVGVVLVLGDRAMLPFLGPAWEDLVLGAGRTLGVTLMGILYGGVTEEIWLRWGLLTLLAWLPWRLFQRGRGEPHRAIMLWAILAAALLFGIGHLPAVAAAVPLTTPAIVRTVGLNAIAGLVYGWLFWRRSLESAMLAHASTHVAMTLVVWAGLG